MLTPILLGLGAYLLWNAHTTVKGKSGATYKLRVESKNQSFLGPVYRIVAKSPGVALAFMQVGKNKGYRPVMTDPELLKVPSFQTAVSDLWLTVIPEKAQSAAKQSANGRDYLVELLGAMPDGRMLFDVSLLDKTGKPIMRVMRVAQSATDESTRRVVDSGAIDPAYLNAAIADFKIANPFGAYPEPTGIPYQPW